MLIKRLNNLDTIWDKQHDFEKDNNIKILNVSDWNCSYEFKNSLSNVLDVVHSQNFVEYSYSYSLTNSITEALKNKYPFCLKSRKDIMITPNNTVSIIYIANLLKQMRINKLCVIAPSYFSIYNALEVFNVPYDKISLQRYENKIQLDKNTDLTAYDAIWITSPVFCNGTLLNDNTLRQIQEFSNEKLVITDESFCNYGMEIPNQIELKYHIGIYSPHKAIGLNSFKFSLITFNCEFMPILEQWSDVLCGSLNATNYDAINHFLSPNYSVCKKTYDIFIDTAKQYVINMLKKLPSFSVDDNTMGNMIMLYAHNVPTAQMYNLSFYEKLMSNTMGCIFPGYLHDYNEDFGFCFRVNLSLYNTHFCNILSNICNYLS